MTISQEKKQTTKADLQGTQKIEISDPNFRTCVKCSKSQKLKIVSIHQVNKVLNLYL